MDYNNFFFSYWDWLPVEIQEIILQIVKALEELDQWRRQKISKILPEIHQIAKLNEMWNKPTKNGLVTFKISRCRKYYCESRVHCWFYKKAVPSAHFYIIGYSVDEENKKQKHFLGYSYSNVKNRMNHVKSFL